MEKKKVSDNLYLYTRGGSSYYIFRGTVGGKRIERSLGRADQMGIKEAKFKAAEVLTTEQPKRPDEMTFGDVCHKALDDIALIRQWKNEATTRSVWTSQIERFAMPVLGDMPLASIGRDDVLAVVKPLWMMKTETAADLQQKLEAVFNWAITRGFVTHNPATWRGNLALFLPPVAKAHTTKHREAPTMEELRAAVASLRERQSPSARILLFTIANACRVSEARLALGKEIKDDTWLVPPEHIKTRESAALRKPLSSLALEAVGDGADPDRLLFPSRVTRGAVVASTLLDAFRGVCQRPEGEPKVTVHGIRSTFRDWCADTGVPDAVAEKALGHHWGNKVTSAYFRSDMLEERRKVMQAWADALTNDGP